MTSPAVALRNRRSLRVAGMSLYFSFALCFSLFGGMHSESYKIQTWHWIGLYHNNKENIIKEPLV